MDEVYCFSCGREVDSPVEPGEMAICGRCRARHDTAATSQLYVRRVGASEQGPLSREALEEQLERGLLGAEDRVREEDGPWKRLDQHPWFSGFFVPGDPRNQKLQAALDKRAQEQAARTRSERVRYVSRFMLGALSVFVVAGASGVLYLRWQDVSDLGAAGQGVAADAVLTTRMALDEEVAAAALAEAQGLPAQELVEEIHARWPVPTDSLQDQLVAGWEGILDGSEEGLAQAQSSLEQAVSQAPESPEAVSALALAYAGSPSAEARGRAPQMLDRAAALGSDSASIRRVKAGMALDAGAFQEAQEHAQACLELDAEDGICHWMLGRAQSRLGEHAQAQAALERAQELLGDAPAVKLGMAIAALEAQRYDQALPLLLAYTRAHPKHAGAQGSLARTYLACGRYKEGLGPARRALAATPGDAALRLDSARLQLGAGRNAEALKTLAPLLEAGSEQEAEARILGARAALEGGKASVAQGHAERALELVPGSPAAALALAQSHLADGEVSNAVGALSQVEEVGIPASERAILHFHLADLQRRMGRLREAEDSLKGALESRPQWIEAQVALAGVQVEAGNLPAALELLDGLWKALPEAERVRDLRYPAALAQSATLAADLERVPIGDPRQQAAQQGLGVVLAQACVSGKGGCDRATAALGEQLKQDNSRIGALYWQARVYLEMGRPSSARGLLDQAVGQQAAVASLLLARGTTLARLRDAAGARADLERAIALAPGGQGLRGHAAAALLAAGELDAARATAQKALQQESADLLARQTLLDLGRAGG
ncbi:MAG: tetratricopeptide repeat protein [Myxococcota bacterium]|nr:tetratricopeptide repeat protein [Myxococcota bacterium]